MSNSFFFLEAKQNGGNTSIIKEAEDFASTNCKQVYILDRLLAESKYNYDYDKALLILMPDYRLIFVNLDKSSEAFDYFVEDVIEDLGSLADKFKYREAIGRPRNWQNLIAKFESNSGQHSFENIISDHKVTDPAEKRIIELLISLITGSINQSDKVQSELPITLLEKIKRKIILFDGDQTRFIYKQPVGDKTSIQGLSGTGKTELLLHKLKELYVKDSDSKIAVTCHNKVLAQSLRERIPIFFNFMKVEEQIDWDTRLQCTNAWGSEYRSNSGIYSKICNHYGLTFHNFKQVSDFGHACKIALDELKENQEKGRNIDDYAFDYILVDESQDFDPNFVELCKRVTRKHVYLAGDIFQSIFDEFSDEQISPDYLLSKCYRTDPRTLMFSHGLGMGLFESRRLKWLRDEEWNACGYIKHKNETTGDIEFTRESLRRFDDLELNDYKSTEIKVSAYTNDGIINTAINTINEIKAEHPDVEPSDIAIIFLENRKWTFDLGDKLAIEIQKQLNWKVNKGYETKATQSNSLFLTNRNNVKGLEFPFVICLTNNILQTRSYRNALYTLLTRSFLRSYLILPDFVNKDFLINITKALENINATGKMVIKEPTKAEIEQIPQTIAYEEAAYESLYDLTQSLFDELDIIPILREPINKKIQEMAINSNNISTEDLREFIKVMNNLLMSSNG